MRISAISSRILAQLRHDKRTMALVLVAPLLVLTLVYFILDTGNTSYTISVISAPADVVHEIKTNEDYDVTVRKDGSRSKAIKTVRAQDAAAAVKVSSDCSRVRIYLDGSNAADAKKVKAIIEQSVAQVVKDDARTSIEKIRDTMAASPMAADTNISYVEPKVTTDYIYGSEDGTLFDDYGAPLIGVIIFFFVFLIAGINFLNERKGGTLERILSTPVRRGEIISGYVLGFGILAILQTVIVSLFVIYVLGMPMEGNIGLVLLINLLTALCALTLGMLLSTLASSEFQMMQFIPLVILPQIFLCGLFRLSGGWDIAGHFIPLYYTTDSLVNVMMRGRGAADIIPDIAVLAGFALLFMTMNIAFLKRQRKV